MKDVRVPFAILYLVVDILYVASSKNVYETVARKIQGSGFPVFTATRVMAALVAYMALVVGWYVFATRLAHELHGRYSAWVAGALAGAAYGFVVYAVFNGTMHAMFKEYDMVVFSRDLLWGMTWATVLTALYSVASHK